MHTDQSQLQPSRQESGPRSDEPDRSPALAGFALLADPDSISGTHERSSPDDRDGRDEEIERLRAALHVRSQEIEALRPSVPERERPTAVVPPSDPTEASPIPASESHKPPGRLLDAATARRLANDARARERASREALAATRQALGIEALAEDESHAHAESSPQRWQRHPLFGREAPTAAASSPSLPNDRAQGETKHHPTPTRHDESDIAGALSAAHADLRALRSTLSIARDTAVAQRAELKTLRNRVSEAERELAETHAQASRGAQAAPEHGEEPDPRIAELERALENAAIEHDRLQDHLAANKREAETREADRILLRQTLSQREREVDARNAQLDALGDRFEAQDDALERARLQFDQERSHNTATQALLDQLRAALALQPDPAACALLDGPDATQPPEWDGASESGSESHPGRPALRDARPVPSEGPEPDRTNATGKSQLDAANAVLLGAEAACGPGDLGAHDAPPAHGARPAIFDAWLDDQVQRNFGPMGIDRVVDLLRAPLARSAASSHSADLDLVLLGRGATLWAPKLVEGLVENGTAAFRVHVGDTMPDLEGTLRRPAPDSPVLDFLEVLPTCRTPDELAEQLTALRPAAVISRDFLCDTEDVSPWLDALAAAAELGACLLFAESTGLGPVDPPEEMTSIGERIWELMPERYTRDRTPEQNPTSWRDAFLRVCAEPTGELLPALRAHFRLSLFAQFGFLAEPFLEARIGANFDPHAKRDRRFLRQISDLDDRKIEAGIAPALHLIAVVDPAAED